MLFSKALLLNWLNHVTCFHTYVKLYFNYILHNAITCWIVVQLSKFSSVSIGSVTWENGKEKDFRDKFKDFLIGFYL